MCDIIVQAIRLIVENLLKIFLPILVSITHSSYLLQILSVMMSPYQGGTDRVVIVSIWVFQCM